MQLSSSPRVRARQIADSDASRVVDLLKKGFGRRRSLRYWQRAVDRLASYRHPEGTPKYGYLMEHDGAPVGVILLIHSKIPTEDGWTIRCNLSSWYVEAPFRSHAALLSAQALRRKDLTYLNISSVRHTRPIIEAQGFTRYSAGQFFALARPTLFGKPEARIVPAGSCPDAPCEPFERDLMADHAGFGCISLWCATPERACPFVFAPRVLKNLLPCVQLIYCRDLDEYVRFARTIGSYLAVRGRPVVLIDANRPIRGLTGHYIDDSAPKYYRGPARPRLGDLAYTEAALFGM